MNKNSLYVLFAIVASSTMHANMQIHEEFTELFKIIAVPTEYTAYQLLKEQPLKADINYLAMPWTVLIKKGKLAEIPDISIDGGFTICQHIHYERIIPILKQIGIDTLFTPHLPTGKTYEGITVLPFPHYPVNGPLPAAEKDILYSFIGCTKTHKVRKEVMKLPKANDVVLKNRGSWHFGQNSKEKDKEENKKEYRDVLARSRFSLCPRGTGASTIRFWESLQAGAIPVLISDAMTLPFEFDWTTCCIRVPQNEVATIDNLIRSIPLEIEEELRANCLAVFELFYGENFVRTIRCHYQE